MVSFNLLLSFTQFSQLYFQYHFTPHLFIIYLSVCFTPQVYSPTGVRCKCGHCQIMDRADECVCCQEIPEMLYLNEKAMTIEKLKEPLTCITDNPAFPAVCLNHWVLRTAWYQYKQQYENPFEGPEHQRHRHVAYRQLARLGWGVLGRHVRVVLPSCGVSCIRAHFPPPGDEDEHSFVGFRPPSEEED